MWKDFFYYSRSERRAVYLLSLLIVAFTIGSVVLPWYVKEPIVESVGQAEEAQFTDSLWKKQQLYPPKKVAGIKRKIILKEFDPNTADSIDFLNLGLSSFVASNVLKYRNKGGTFANPEAFARIYGMQEDLFMELKPYIRIADEYHYKPIVKQRVDSVMHPKDSFPRIVKYPEGTLVDVGMADTTELKKIPGIGSAIAAVIVAYRERLGGFYSLKQLKEVEYVTPDIMKWLVLQEMPIRKLPINKAGLDRLRAHPYINFYQARVIVEYRKKKGKIKSLSQLSLYEEFTEKDLDRLKHYFIFD